ncbi:TetR/AcrR family transcriptional regulator, partial [Escherichia coli]|uniref:TetR/AcrR family transcriptional regulator n=2 Tax=Pseudomonadota TaxID=1224 RepID=UPI001953AA48
MHFRDKAEILMEICEQSIRSLLTINTEIAARPVDPVARVRLMLEAYMRFALDNPNAYLIVFCATPRE